jgi:hypothetical protein
MKGVATMKDFQEEVRDFMAKVRETADIRRAMFGEDDDGADWLDAIHTQLSFAPLILEGQK